MTCRSRSKSYWGLVLLVLLAAAPSWAQSGRLLEVTVASPALAANLLGDPAARPVLIYLPPQYDREPEQRFPVLYLLHGFGVNHELWKGPSLQGRGVALQELLEELLTAGKIKPFIVVMPEARNAYGGSFYLNSPVTGGWEDFISRDLVRFVDTNFRTRPEARGRALAGHSMGGYGVIWLGARHPEVFGAGYALSPACLVFAEQFLQLMKDDLLAAAKVPSREIFPRLPWRQQVVIALAAAVAPDPHKPPFLAALPFREVDGQMVLDQGIWERWLQSDPYTQLPQWRDNLLRLRLAFDMGTSDRLLPQARLFAAALQRAGIPHTYEEYEGDHSNRLRDRLRERALPWLADFLTRP